MDTQTSIGNQVCKILNVVIKINYWVTFCIINYYPEMTAEGLGFLMWMTGVLILQTGQTSIGLMLSMQAVQYIKLFVY